MPLMMGSTNRGVHVELYVRSLAPRGALDRQQSAVQLIEQLAGEGRLSTYSVHVCGREIPATPGETTTDFGAFLLNRVAVFSMWADRNGYSLGRLFDRRTLDSTITDEHRETLVMPVMALAEYEGTDLRFVAPCSVDGTSLTVRHRLNELHAGEHRDATPLPDAHAPPPDEKPPLVQ